MRDLLVQAVDPERLCASVEWITVKECGTWVWAHLTALSGRQYGSAVRSQVRSEVGVR